MNLDPPLVPSSTRAVPGYGDPQSPVVIVGQSLCGKNCIDAEIPFTGGSGKLLDDAFKAADIEKSQIFITNVVHCHPPGNRQSMPHEIANCSEYLADELRILHPRLIIGLGRDAHIWLSSWNALQAESFQISQVWNPPMTEGERWLLQAAHPSWIKRKPEKQMSYVSELAQAMIWAFAIRGVQR